MSSTRAAIQLAIIALAVAGCLMVLATSPRILQHLVLVQNVLTLSDDGKHITANTKNTAQFLRQAAKVRYSTSIQPAEQMLQEEHENRTEHTSTQLTSPTSHNITQSSSPEAQKQQSHVVSYKVAQNIDAKSNGVWDWPGVGW
jgi:hypothetical protein